MKAVFDTNILIDYLKGITEAAEEISRFQVRTISIISYIEIMVGLDDPSLIKKTKAFLDSFEMVAVNAEVAELAVAARKSYKLKIPDAIILATAQVVGGLLVTRNTKDFPSSMPIVRMPYKV